MVEKLRLNVHIPFMLVLYDFIIGSLDTGTIVDAPDIPAAARSSSGSDNSAAGTVSTSFNVYGSLKQPEVVIFADPSVADSRVFVVYVSLSS